MRNMIDHMFRRQPPAIDAEKQELYAKFRVLGANINRLSQLGLDISELEQLLGRLEKVHDKKLVRLISELTQFHPSVEDPAPQLRRSKNIFKNCPRCTRELTETNVIKDHHSDEFDIFVLICECGYVREIKNRTSKVAGRQSSLYEYPFVRRRAGNESENTKISWLLSVYKTI